MSDVYLTSRNLLTADLQEEAAVVENTQAPPATVLLQRLHDQIPTQERFMASWKKKHLLDHRYFKLYILLIFKALEKIWFSGKKTMPKFH